MSVDKAVIDAIPPEHSEVSKTIAIQEFGFWVYLLTDLVLFSVLFATFLVLGRSYANGPTGRDLFDLPYILVETMLLLLSTATCSLAILAMQKGKKSGVLFWLVITFLLGLGFIAMEAHEFYGIISEGNGPHRSAFLSAFFTLVGTHGAHVLCGLIWGIILLSQILLKGLTSPVQSRLTRLSMFWHFLDFIWIGVFTVVYLMEMAL